MVADADHTWDADVRVAGVAGGESLLGGSFQPVIEFLGHPVPQLGEQRLGVQPRHKRTEKPGATAQLIEIADQRPARARVLDLDGNLAPIVPHSPVHLADGGRSRRLVVEPGEAGPPLLAHVAREHLVNSPGRQRRRGFLQPGQGGPVRFGDLRGQRGLEYRQRLPELHRAALELAKDPEDLICCPLLDFLGHQLSWPAAQALAGSQRGPACEPNRQPSQPGRAGDSVAGQIAHHPILHCAGITHHSDRQLHPGRRPAHRYRAARHTRRHPVSRSGQVSGSHGHRIASAHRGINCQAGAGAPPWMRQHTVTERPARASGRFASSRRLGVVRAENLVHGSDQQGLLSRPSGRDDQRSCPRGSCSSWSRGLPRGCGCHGVRRRRKLRRS